MPAKKGGKKKHKKKTETTDNSAVLLKMDDQEYAIVTKLLGDRRVTAECFDGKTRCCLIRGKMRKRVWIKQDDIVLVALREFDEDKGDIIHKYSADHAKILEKDGEISSTIIKQNSAKSNLTHEIEQETVFDFDDI
jgi:translation initiation factor 1A